MMTETIGEVRVLGIIRKAKSWLKRNRKSKNMFLRWGIRLLDIGVGFFRGVRDVLTDRNARAIFCMRFFQPSRTHQTTAATCLDRYPVIFRGCREYFGEKPDLKLLSFGCATGEEVITLRKYFPQAEIVGAEINKNSLRICRERKLDDKIRFVDSLPEEIRKYGPYDGIFCMAVFQRTPGLIAEREITDLSRIYPFEKFDKQVAELDQWLKPDGLMVIHMSQYDFSDTRIAERYAPYGEYHQNYYSRYVFDKHSKLKKELGYRYSIYRKQ